MRALAVVLADAGASAVVFAFARALATFVGVVAAFVGVVAAFLGPLATFVDLLAVVRATVFFAFTGALTVVRALAVVGVVLAVRVGLLTACVTRPVSGC